MERLGKEHPGASAFPEVRYASLDLSEALPSLDALPLGSFREPAPFDWTVFILQTGLHTGICVFTECRTESEFIEGLTQDLRATHVLGTRRSFTTPSELRPNFSCKGFSADRPGNAEFDRASDSEPRVISSAISEGEDPGNELEDCRDLTGPTRGQERDRHSRGMLAWSQCRVATMPTSTGTR